MYSFSIEREKSEFAIVGPIALVMLTLNWNQTSQLNW